MPDKQAENPWRVEMVPVGMDDFSISKLPIEFGPELKKFFWNAVANEHTEEDYKYHPSLNWFSAMALRTAYMESPDLEKRVIKDEMGARDDLELTFVPDFSQFQKAYWTYGEDRIMVSLPGCIIGKMISGMVADSLVRCLNLYKREDFLSKKIKNASMGIFAYDTSTCKEFVSDVVVYSRGSFDSKMANYLLQSVGYKGELPVIVRNPRVTVNPDFHYEYPQGHNYSGRKDYRGFELTKANDTEVFKCQWPENSIELNYSVWDIDPSTGFPVSGKAFVIEPGTERHAKEFGSPRQIFRTFRRFNYKLSPPCSSLPQPLRDVDDFERTGLSTPIIMREHWKYRDSEPWRHHHSAMIRVVAKPN